MRKRLIITAILLFVTAALLLTLFVGNLTAWNFIANDDGGTDAQPTPDDTTTPDDTPSSNEPEANIGTALLWLLSILPSFLWPICAIAFVVIGILLLVGQPENLNGSLITAIVFGAVGLPFVEITLLGLLLIYIPFVPLLAILAAVLMATYIANFVVVCVTKVKLKNYIYR